MASPKQDYRAEDHRRVQGRRRFCAQRVSTVVRQGRHPLLDRSRAGVRSAGRVPGRCQRRRQTSRVRRARRLSAGRHPDRRSADCSRSLRSTRADASCASEYARNAKARRPRHHRLDAGAVGYPGRREHLTSSTTRRFIRRSTRRRRAASVRRAGERRRHPGHLLRLGRDRHLLRQLHGTPLTERTMPESVEPTDRLARIALHRNQKSPRRRTRARTRLDSHGLPDAAFDFRRYHAARSSSLDDTSQPPLTVRLALLAAFLLLWLSPSRSRSLQMGWIAPRAGA